MAESVPIDTRDITITPLFRVESIEDVNESERQGHLVKRMREVVEVRFAGSKNYSPVFPVDAFWQRVNGRIVTYAERWSDQYRAFLEGSSQEARGTPLEMLKSQGISDAHLSLCRALKIYSIEALFHLEGTELKNLGMAGNSLKDMARAFMAERRRSVTDADEMDSLRAELAALKALMVIPPVEAKPEEIDAAVIASDAAFDALSDTELKSYIKEKTGQAPRGTPSRDFLLNAAKELAA